MHPQSFFSSIPPIRIFPLFFKNFIYLFIYLWLCWVLVSARGPSPVAASGGQSSSRCAGYRGLSCCRAQAPDAQAQQLWLTGPVAPRHVGSSQTRARTRVPCTGRQILNHCATREALIPSLYVWISIPYTPSSLKSYSGYYTLSLLFLNPNSLISKEFPIFYIPNILLFILLLCF